MKVVWRREGETKVDGATHEGLNDRGGAQVVRDRRVLPKRGCELLVRVGALLVPVGVIGEERGLYEQLVMDGQPLKVLGGRNV